MALGRVSLINPNARLFYSFLLPSSWLPSPITLAASLNVANEIIHDYQSKNTVKRRANTIVPSFTENKSTNHFTEKYKYNTM